MRYSIDTSAILDGWVRYYPPDTFSSLWERIESLIENGTLRATEEVLYELEKKSDEVCEWARQQDELFVELDDETQLSVSDILSRHPKLIDTRANRSAADPFVIGLARVNGCAVVTGERSTGSLDRPNIPDVCVNLEVACMSLLDLIRREGWRF